VEAKHFSKNTRYRLLCRFQDRAGDWHTFTCTARHEQGGEFVPPLDRATLAAIQARALPHPVAVAYDPDWPGRGWLVEAGWRWDEFSYGYRFQGISVIVLLYQVIGVPLFLCLGASRTGQEYHKAVPLLIEGGVLVLFGLGYRLNAGE
jgi:hypothetical protein